MNKQAMLKFIDIKKKYNNNFSKYNNKKEKPLAWVTSFTPIEILYAMDIDFIFPESYSVVMASKNDEKGYIEKAVQNNFDSSLCSYSTCFNGSYFLNEGPNGVPLKPDILIASNNQCSTLTGWWNYLSNLLDVPLYIIDYPGNPEDEDISDYIIKQHEELIEFLKINTKRDFDENKVNQAIENSIKSIDTWNKILDLSKDNYVSSNITLDYLFPLIISRHKNETYEFYKLFYEQLKNEVKPLKDEKRILWFGYPLWYSPNRYLEGIENDDFKIIVNDYSSWWNIDYSGSDWKHKLAYAYNTTILNRTLNYRIEAINNMINEFKIDGVIFNSNKSCKRESSCIYPIKDNINVPSVVINSDMVDKQYMNQDATALKIDTFKEVIF